MPSSQGTGPWEQRTSMPSNLGLTSSRPAIEAVGSARETNTPKAVPAADETAMAARGLSHTSEDRSIWTVAERRATVSCAMECRGVLAPRSKALQSQTRTAKRSKRLAISASGSGMQHGGVERGQPERTREARLPAYLRVRFLWVRGILRD